MQKAAYEAQRCDDDSQLNTINASVKPVFKMRGDQQSYLSDKIAHPVWRYVIAAARVDVWTRSSSPEERCAVRSYVYATSPRIPKWIGSEGRIRLEHKLGKQFPVDWLERPATQKTAGRLHFQIFG